MTYSLRTARKIENGVNCATGFLQDRLSHQRPRADRNWDMAIRVAAIEETRAYLEGYYQAVVDLEGEQAAQIIHPALNWLNYVLDNT